MATAVVRRLTAADADGLTRLIDRARDAGDLAGSSSPHGDWVVRYATSQPEQVAVAIDEADGALIGVVLPEVKALVVEPGHRRRGIGRALVEEGLRIERERGRPNLLLGLVPDEEPGHAFVGATGFELHSTLWDLDLESDVDVAEPVWPEGTRARQIDRERDIRAWVELFNAAFADHATPLQLDADRIEADKGAAPFRDEDLLLLESASGRLVGFCASEPKRSPDGDVEPRAEIWTVGVRPDAQGLGHGRQLLRWGIHHLRDVGATTVTLSVNGRNAGALGLYESEGFHRTATRERWARPA
jgi:mycothiol synthase